MQEKQPENKISEDYQQITKNIPRLHKITRKVYIEHTKMHTKVEGQPSAAPPKGAGLFFYNFLICCFLTVFPASVFCICLLILGKPRFLFF